MAGVRFEQLAKGYYQIRSKYSKKLLGEVRKKDPKDMDNRYPTLMFTVPKRNPESHRFAHPDRHHYLVNPKALFQV